MTAFAIRTASKRATPMATREASGSALRRRWRTSAIAQIRAPRPAPAPLLPLEACDTLADLRDGAPVAASRKPQWILRIQRLPAL
jgi:hypothetical protein